MVNDLEMTSILLLILVGNDLGHLKKRQMTSKFTITGKRCSQRDSGFNWKDAMTKLISS